MQSRLKEASLLAGPALALLVYSLVPQSDLDPTGRATIAMAAWMACWWMTEAIPLAATALLPVVAFPLLGIASPLNAAAPYAQPLIFLFLGGFLIGCAIQRCGLHRRVALIAVSICGTKPSHLVLGFMLATAFLSMWISNTSAVIIMLPIAASVLAQFEEPDTAQRSESGPSQALAELAPALMLGVAYGASIGGVGTLIGTPPNLVFASFAQQNLDVEISMLSWFSIGLPLVGIMLPLCWLCLTKWVFKVDRGGVASMSSVIGEQLAALGSISGAEKRVLAVFVLTACAWSTRPLLVEWFGLSALSDPIIAMTGALVLFAVPLERSRREFALDSRSFAEVPWQVLIIFGGGLALASAISANQVDDWLAGQLIKLGDLPPLVLLLSVTVSVILLTEITSNTAVATTLMPVLLAASQAFDTPPGPLLVAAALAASCAFMLPVATPANAIVFGSKHVELTHMLRAGAILNLIAVAVVTMIVSWFPGPFQ